MSPPDVCVVGAGPAGLGLAAELAERGLAVHVVAPSAGWIPGYGCWDDDLDALLEPHLAGLLRASVHHAWTSAHIHTDTVHHQLARTYLRFHTPALQAAFEARASAAGVVRHHGTVTALGAPTGGLQPHMGSLGTRHARLVVDATGGGLPETRALRPPSPGPGYQVAFGQRITVASHPWTPGQMVLMDWRRLRASQVGVGDVEALPTFLYALPFSETDLFVEETVLSARPLPSMELCAARLEVRLAQLGISPLSVEETERCIIPMGGPLPDLSRSTRALVPFGAAAGLVHPATGYSLIQSLRLAPAVAATITEALATTDGQGAARAAWQTLWPNEARRNRALYRYGQEVLLDLPLHAMQRFYEAFFAAEAGRPDPDQLWRDYMSDRHTPATVARLMARVFAAAGTATRIRLARGGSGSDHLAMVRALIGL